MRIKHLSCIAIVCVAFLIVVGVFIRERETVSEAKPVPHFVTMERAPEWSIAIHGGAGGGTERWSEDQKRMRLEGLSRALQSGVDLLSRSGDAIDVVEAVIRILEDDPNFNAGRGTVLNDIGEFSLDASIMDGTDLSCGAVANVTRVRNPIALARAVRDKTSHVLLCGPPADLFAESTGLPLEPPEYFKTTEQIESWKRWRKRQESRTDGSTQRTPVVAADRESYFGTVGCVVRDARGNLAAGTSTGGLLGKKYGRVGDSPIIGAGTYANNATCAVSCTGTGELYIKHHIASAISARMEHLHESLEQSATHAIRVTLPDDSGGLIAVDSNGNLQTVRNTSMMSRGEANANGLFRVSLGDW